MQDPITRSETCAIDRSNCSLELERRGRAVTASASADAAQAGEWVGVALKMAGEVYLVAREEAREVWQCRRR